MRIHIKDRKVKSGFATNISVPSDVVKPQIIFPGIAQTDNMGYIQQLSNIIITIIIIVIIIIIIIIIIIGPVRKGIPQNSVLHTGPCQFCH